jgi:glycosyltransferase involved in cell wall biosynthesis
LAALSTQLRENGVQPRIYMFQRVGYPVSPYIAYLEKSGVDHVVLPDRGRWDLGLIRNLDRELAEWNPDIIQTHSYRMTAFVYLLKRRRALAPWIAFFHGTTNEYLRVRLYNLIDRALLPRADRLVVMSEVHRRSFASLGERVRVVHNAVLQLPQGGASVSFAAVRHDSDHVIGVIGRLSPEKGVDVLLDAVSRCRANGMKLLLVVAGDGPARGPLERQAERLGVADHVHFLGAVADIAALYPRLDLVVIPSRSEGLPNVLLEALNADVPIVATRVGAVPEVLSDELAGEMVLPEDAEALAAAISRALTVGRDPAASAARASVAAQFSLPTRVNHHLALYAELRPDRLLQASPAPAQALPEYERRTASSHVVDDSPGYFSTGRL